MSPTNNGKSDLKFTENFKAQNENVRLTYWEKINQKKELKKKKTEWLLKNQQKKTFEVKNNEAKNAQDNALNLLNIGNASEIGQRNGEKLYEPVGEQREIEQDRRVSILRKNGNVQSDIHMKIIIYHKQEHIREQLFADLREKMLSARQKLKTKSWQDILQGCWTSVTSSCFKKVPPFVNKYDIDDFIDEWWMYNCPDSYSTSDINRQVYNLIHQLFLIDEEEVKQENEA
tara:strand:- start:108 stop:797 length:690 start_codon:yes stop_codon:yes gene_type:complete